MTTENTENTENRVTTTPPKKNNKLALLALLVACVALGLNVFIGVTTQQGKTKAALHTLQSSVAVVSQDSKLQVETLQKQVASLKNTLPLTTQKILAEVSFLVTVANTQLTADNDPVSALQTLKTAQALVAAANDARFMALSAAIQSDREALSKINMPNTAQLFDNLSSVIQKIQALTTLPQATPMVLNTTLPAADANKPWYQKALAMLAQLKTLIVIRHVNENNPPLIAANMEVYLKQNITMQLSMAQWALLHHQQSIYQAALVNAQEWTAHYFTLTAEKDSVSTLLTQLATANVAPAMPTLTNTLNALSQINLQTTTPA